MTRGKKNITTDENNAGNTALAVINNPLEVSVKAGQNLDYYIGIINQRGRDLMNCYIDIGLALVDIESGELFREKGYANMVEFGENEFHFKKSTMYNIMRVVKTYVDMETRAIAERYREFSFRQLVEILSLPADLREEITPNMTTREIADIKREHKELAQNVIDAIEVKPNSVEVVDNNIVQDNNQAGQEVVNETDSQAGPQNTPENTPDNKPAEIEVKPIDIPVFNLPQINTDEAVNQLMDAAGLTDSQTETETETEQNPENSTHVENETETKPQDDTADDVTYSCPLCGNVNLDISERKGILEIDGKLIDVKKYSCGCGTVFYL